MTTIRNKKALRQYNSPDDRLRHCEGEIDEYMAGKEPSVDAAWLCVKGALVLLVLGAVYAVIEWQTTVEPYKAWLAIIAALGLIRIWYERRQQRLKDEAEIAFKSVRGNYGRVTN